MRMKYIAFGLLVFSAIFFVQLPLQHSLPGKLDTWFYISTYEYIIGWLEALLNGHSFGNSLYPESSHLQFGNFSVGMGLVYILARVAGLDVIWSFYILTVLVFWGNAIGVTLVSRHFKLSSGSALVVGFLTSFNNYTLSNLDNLDGLCWAPGLLGLYYLGKFLDFGSPRYIWTFSILSGIQLYFSSYMFLLSGVAVLVALPSMIWQISNNMKLIGHAFGAALVGMILILPFVYLYMVMPEVKQAYNPATDPEVLKFTGLHWIDLFTYLPYTLYSNIFKTAGSDWYGLAHSAGIGLVFPLVGALGLMHIRNLKRYLILLFFLYILLAIGPVLFVRELEIPNLTYPVLEGLGLRNLFRINIRAWLPAIFILALGFGVVIDRIRSKWALLVFAIVALENLPLRLSAHESDDILARVLRSTQIHHFSADDVVLHLPSSFYSSFYAPFKKEGVSFPDAEPEILQEYNYMLHQAWTGANSLNGFVAFIPKSRMENQMRILALEDAQSKDLLIRQNHINYILIHKWAICNSVGWGSEGYFSKAFQNLEVVYESNDFKLLAVDDR